MSNFNFAFNSQKGREAVINSTIVKSVEALENIALTAKDGQKCYLDDGGRSGNFTMRSARSSENDGGTIFNGMERDDVVFKSVKWFGAKVDSNTNDTNVLQTLIDSQNQEWLTNGAEYKALPIYVPSGECVISSLYIKGGTNLVCDGVFKPADDISPMVYMAGSNININKLHLYGNLRSTYEGTPFCINTADTTTSDILDTDHWKQISYVNIGELYINGVQGKSEAGFKVSSDVGVSWWEIDKLIIRDCTKGVDISVTNGGYFNSAKIKGEIHHCVKSINLTTDDTSEISSNVFDFHTQPLNTTSASGISCNSERVHYNKFLGRTWDWQTNYSYSIYDIGQYNSYDNNLVTLEKYGKVLFGRYSRPILEANTMPSYQNLYQWNTLSHNGIGFQDNLLANAGKTKSGVVITTNSPNHHYSIPYLFEQQFHPSYNTYLDFPTDGTPLTLEIEFPEVQTIYTVGIGLLYLTSSCTDCKIELDPDGNGYTNTFLDVTGNITQEFIATRENSAGYLCKKMRITFDNFVDKSDPLNIVPTSEDNLSLKSLAVFGIGKRQAFASMWDNKFLGLKGVASNEVPDNSFFLDTDDSTLKFKTDDGTVKTVSLA